MNRKERTELFLRRLVAAPVCSSADEALAQMSAILNAVENEFTSIPFNLSAWESDGRLYPPQVDQRRDVEGYPAIRRYRSKQHNGWIAENGAIKIMQGRTLCLEKPGMGGKTISTMMETAVSKR
jgi:hypothetical protein